MRFGDNFSTLWRALRGGKPPREELRIYPFGTSEMLKKDTLCSVVKRRLGTLSHFRFQKKLKSLCSKYGRTLIIVDESYKTKTCGSCGELQDVGGSKVYTCDCGYLLPRDIRMFIYIR